MKMETATAILTIKRKVKRQKAIKQEVHFKFIRVDPDKKDFNIFRAINEIFRYIKQLTKKTLTNEISFRVE